MHNPLHVADFCGFARGRRVTRDTTRARKYAGRCVNFDPKGVFRLGLLSIPFGFLQLTFPVYPTFSTLHKVTPEEGRLKAKSLCRHKVGQRCLGRHLLGDTHEVPPVQPKGPLHPSRRNNRYEAYRAMVVLTEGG
jgi:hypothetical protein